MDENLADKVCDALERDRPDDINGKCALCDKEVNAEFFCFGCCHFVCTKHRNSVLIIHSLSAHRFKIGKISRN
jgi:hypothetical protein